MLIFPPSSKHISTIYFIYYLIKVQPTVRLNLLEYYLSDKESFKESHSTAVANIEVQERQSPNRALARRSTAKIKGKYLVKLSVDSPLIKQNTLEPGNLQRQSTGDDNLGSPIKLKPRFQSSFLDIQEESELDKNGDDEFKRRNLRRSV